MVMDKDRLTDALARISCALGLDRKVAGVKFLFDEGEFALAKPRQVKTKMPYCVMVKMAMTGRSVKALKENFGCPASARALGIVDVDETVSSGRHYRSLGLYQDLATSKDVQKNMTLCRHRAFATMIMPLEEFEEAPDVVLIVTKPYNAMRIIQGYTYAFGYQTGFKMAGNQALCSECTAYPFESNRINVSLLCSGTRHTAGWGDDEVGIGFPFNKLMSLVDGIYQTLNPTEPNEKKAGIESRLKEQGRTDFEIEYDRNYYNGLYLR